ncbi:MAG: hypothetical protein JXR25_15265 [Pontiellaceae bacterium]|nr:hypothetical protein [Pontiellaceae bacterium]MBN2786180.1 hypothetical protein [Pontiellaceae bacterium]
MKNNVKVALIAGSLCAAGLSQAALVHRYDFETDASDSVGTADAIIYGVAAVTNGGLESGSTDANRISGTLVNGVPSNGAMVPSSATASITNEFTIEMWYTVGYGGPYNTAFSFSDGTTDNYVIGCPARGDNNAASSVDAKGGGSTPSGKLALGQYGDNTTLQHMIATFDGTTLTYYQNSSVDYNGFNTLHGYSASIDATGLNLSTLPLIGINGGSPWGDNSMAGSVWDFRIYDNAISAGQAVALFELGQDATVEDIAAALLVPDPLGKITSSPTGTSVVDGSVTVQSVIKHGSSVVDTALTKLYIDGGDPVDATFDVGVDETTVSYISALPHGVHTGKVVVVGTPVGAATNTWTFTVVREVSNPISLIHHWDFNENTGTIVNDSVGTADGTIMGENYTWVDGALELPGDGNSGDWNGATNTTVGSYVDLPNGMMSELPNVVTFEATYIDNESRGWARLWDFGSNTLGTEDVSDAGGLYCFLSPNRNGESRIQIGISPESPNRDLFVLISDQVTSGELIHIVWVYDSDNDLIKLYKNGVLFEGQVLNEKFAFSDMFYTDNNNWFGRSQFAGDAMFKGQIDDIRIYSGIMTAAEVAARYAEITNTGGPTGAPVINSIQVSGSTVTLNWTDEGTGTYSVERKSALTEETWTPVLSNLSAAGAEGATTNFTDSNATGFYQIKGE